MWPFGDFRVILVALLAVTSGCAGLGTVPETATVSPAPVPAMQTPTEQPPAPVVNGGFWDDTPVTDHLHALGDTDYTYTHRLTVAGDRSGAFVRTVAVDGENRLIRVRVNGSLRQGTDIASATTWVVGPRTWTRVTRPSGVTEFVNAPVFQPYDTGGAVLLRAIFGSSNISTDGYQGSAAYAAFTTDQFAFVYHGPVPGIDRGRNAVAYMRIHRSGVIERVQVRFETSVRGTPVSATVVQTVKDLGNTSVTKPAWVQDIG